jgi:hypothetical protein
MAPLVAIRNADNMRLEVSSFNTGLPKNLDDEELYPDKTEPAPRMDRFTDMTFSLLRCEITDMMRTMADKRRICAHTAKSFHEMTLQERDTWILSCEQYLNQRYVQHCSPSHPLQWVCALPLFNQLF